MRDLPPGWATDLAILELTGAEIDERGDHLVVRSPANPLFHWGNCLFVLDEGAVDDAARWVRTFEAAFPAAGWVSVGLVRMADDVTAWTEHGVVLELDEVLTSQRLPRRTPPPAGYDVRRLDGADWEQAVVRSLEENDLTGEHEPVSHEVFVRDITGTRRDLSDRGLAAFFGAFHEGTLVADLGVVCCGTTARYQAVSTDAGHRGRGLASHLLGVAAQWSAEHGCDRWVIVTEATNPAGRVYRRAGFAPDAASATAYRAPVHGAAV